jgi:hypothetical protein
MTSLFSRLEAAPTDDIQEAGYMMQDSGLKNWIPGFALLRRGKPDRCLP